jgi:stage II sporulation protein M
MKKRKDDNKISKLIIDNLNSSARYFKKIKIYLVISLILFFVFSFIGYIGLVKFISPELSNKLENEVMKQIEEILNQTEGMNPFQLIGFIIANNVKTSFFGAIFGIFFGILPFMVLVSNGYILGFAARHAVYSQVNNIGIFILWRLLPHGIFEIPAVLISIALGIRIGMFPFYIKDKKRGFLSLLLSLIIFIFLASIITSIFIFLSNPNVLLNKDMMASEAVVGNILSNPILAIFYYICFGAVFVASVYIGLNFLNKNDKKIVFGDIKDSIRTFIFIVVPLLVVAGIIEGILISLMG